MSSAILYLAIIAIWACVLVPRWIHKPHRVPEADELPGLQYFGTAGQPDSGTRRAASASGDAPLAASAAASAATATASAGASAGAGAGAGAGGDARETRDRSADSAVAQRPAAEDGVAWHRVMQRRSYHSERQVPEGYQAHHAPGRARVLQARRRLLTMLVTLAIVALACTVGKLTPSWILVPPAGMLGMYLLVLREAAQADAEQAGQLAQERALIAETIRNLGARGTPEATAQAVCRQVMSLTGVTSAQFFLFELDGRALPIGFVVAGQDDPPLRRLPAQRSRHLYERAMEGPWIEPWVNRPWHPYNQLLT